MNEPLVKFLVFILLALLLLKTPGAGKYVSLVNTLVHEVWHALIAKLTGGRVAKIELFANTEGTAWASHRFWFGKVLTSLAGYPGASATAFLFVYLTLNNRSELVMLILSVILVFSALFWIRNLYGILWVLSSILAFGALYWLNNPVLSENVALALTAVLFVASITTAFDILKISVKTPMNAGDATNLMKSTLIPAQIWGMLFFTQSLAFGFFGIRMLYMA